MDCNKRDGFASAGEDGAVVVYRNNAFEKYLVRSTVPVRCLSYSASGKKVAVAGDEDIIRLILVQDISKVVRLEGHSKTVKSVAYSPSDSYLVSTDCDGDVLIWDLEHESGAPKCIKTLKGAMGKSQPDSSILGTIAWKPDSTQFAFAGRLFGASIYSVDGWIQTVSLDDGHYDDITTLAWSPNGTYLCTAGADNQILVWDVEKKEIVAKRDSSGIVSGLAWHPSANQLAFTDRQGHLTVWNEPVPVTLVHPARSQKNHSVLDSLIEDEVTQTSVAKPHSLIRDEADEEVEEEVDNDVEMMSDMDDFVIDDDGAGYAEGAVEHPAKQQHSLARGKGNKEGRAHVFDPPRFQPGATEFRSVDTTNAVPREGDRRYMAFNMFGVIYTIYQGAYSVINVEFHDQSSHRNFHFKDYTNYTIAAIGNEGLVLGVAGGDARSMNDDEGDDENTEKPSLIHYRPLSNWANNAEWTVYLPKGEDVLCLAINDESVIASTSAGYVRVYTISGVQVHLFRLENVITMVGQGSLAMLVYEVGSNLNGAQNLEFMLMDTFSQEVIQKDKLPLQKNTQLTWIGFSEGLQAVMADSRGIVSVLHKQRQFGKSVWVPIFDGEQVAKALQRAEWYWPVGLLREQLMCVALKGSHHRAPYFPRPPVTDMGLRMPTVHMDTEIGKLEEKHLRIHYMTQHEKDELAAAAAGYDDDEDGQFIQTDLEMDKTLLQLIQMACKDDKQQRVLDLTYALHMSRSIDAAIKIATHHKLSLLAEKITQIKEVNFGMFVYHSFV
ncbi:WD40-repeat-containing domain protein [Dichotomocladium elegans]|nr:WD40-repeat-containing domain protein [Dichotomocladium elegans]